MTTRFAKLALTLFSFSVVMVLTACKPSSNGTPPARPPAGVAVAELSSMVAQDDFKHGLDQWVVEQMPGGTVTAKDGILTIADREGCTVWYKQKLTAPVAITYQVTMSSEARVSDLNCFWMASDAAHPDNLFFQNHTRTGKFGTYDALRTYYVGYGGNANTTTRFRRYDGTGARPLLPEHDLSDAPNLLKGDHTYTITVIAQDGEARFICDGKTVFTYKDPQPLTEGWFGFRTVDSKMLIKNFRVYTPE